MLKDLDLVRAEARAVGLETAPLEGVRTVLANTLARGLADPDYSALYQAVNPEAADADHE